jgi:methylated-DNA-[protein]-cysteine S-methyltransferase
MTDFQTRVYDALKKIPKGKVSTYKLLGNYLDCGSAQAIGQALKKNPFAPEVPCHRIIKSDLSIGGYYGATSGEKIIEKVKLLKSEGVCLDESGSLLKNEQIYKFSN